jgi:DNA-binding MarR family transcriptional regulator
MAPPLPDLVAVAAELRRAASRLHRHIRGEGPPGGLTPLGLRILADLNRLGPETASTMALRDGIRLQSLTRIVADLERQGLIRRERDPADRRSRRIVLTAKGGARLTAEAGHRDRWLAEAMRSLLSRNEIATVAAAAPLIDRLGAWQGEVPA